MSTVNALIAFNSTQVENFLDNFRFTGEFPNQTRVRTDFAPFQTTADRPVTLDPYNCNHLLVNLQSHGMWKPRDEAGPATTILVNMQMIDTLQPDEDEPTDDKIAMIEYLRTFFDGRFQVLGVWWGPYPEFITQDGESVMHGEIITRATYDENGDELTPETIGGHRTYPLNPNYLKWMPDDVVYDENGDEVSRTDATEFKQVNQTLGWKSRRV